MLGAGPAGCAAARLLAQWGHDVLIVTKAAVTGAALAESIPPSTRKLFDVLGIRGTIESARFVHSTGNTVWWGSDAPRVEYFAHGEHGWQVTADKLEVILRDAATAAGAHLMHARMTADDALARNAQFVIDATGRSGIFARTAGVRLHEDDLRTVALLGAWESSSWELPDASHTVIESYDDGWAWSLPDCGDRRYVAVMVDPRTSDLARAVEARRVYEHEISKTRQFSKLTAGARLADGPVGWNASMYSARHYVDGNVLLVGDAGSFIDPLSSAGVKKALASGWLAAVAVHTSVVRPLMKDIALAFYDAREREVYESFRAMTRRFLAEAASGHAHPFWNDRSEGEKPGTNDDAARVAFERIRSAPTLSVAMAPDVTIQPMPAVTGREVVLEPRLVSTTDPHGVRYVFDVDVFGLVRLAPTYRSVPELFAAYNQTYAPVALPDFLAALSTAVAHKWLLWV